jgi:hypothetical protein
MQKALFSCGDKSSNIDMRVEVSPFPGKASIKSQMESGFPNKGSERNTASSSDVIMPPKN